MSPYGGIEKDCRDRWFFKRPDGLAVPACGYRQKDMRDDEVDTVGEYFHVGAGLVNQLIVRP
jgi:hypothetical protein